jgi:hypothetical protein
MSNVEYPLVVSVIGSDFAIAVFSVNAIEAGR